MSMKNSNYTTGNRTRELLACSAVPQPTAPPRATNFPEYQMKILLGDFNAKVGRENIFKPTHGNESLHQDSNDNGVRIVNFTT